MKENEKNVQYDLIESKKDSSNQNMLNENKNVNRNYNIENHKNFNCLYFLISFIVNFAIAIIAICEYIRRIKNNKLITIFIYFVDIFILIAFIIVFCYFFTKKICFLKGLKPTKRKNINLLSIYLFILGLRRFYFNFK